VSFASHVLVLIAPQCFVLIHCYCQKASSCEFYLYSRLAGLTCSRPRLPEFRDCKKKLHWLPICQRISYKLATLTFRSPNHFHTTIPVECTFSSQKHRLLASVNRSSTVDRAKNKNINCRTAFLLCRTFSLEHIA